MKILASSNNGKYIGGNLFDIESHYDEYTEDQYDEIRENFAEEQIQYVQNFSDNYIVYRPKSEYTKFELRTDDYILPDIWEGMSLKEGANLIAYPDHLEVIGYDSGYVETIYLYPISDTKAKELEDILWDADFDNAIEMEIAQYTWNGASVEDVLKTWRY